MSLHVDYIAVTLDAALDAMPRLFELGYLLRLGTAEETLDVRVLGQLPIELPNDGELVLVAISTRGMGRNGFPWATVITEAGHQWRQIMTSTFPDDSIITGQMRDVETHEPVLGHFYVPRSEDLELSVSSQIEMLGLTGRVYFDPDPELPADR